MVTIETDKAKFRIAYGSHIIESKPEELGIADVWLPETGGRVDYTLSKETVEGDFNNVLKKSEPFITEYSELFKEAEENRTPIFLGDIAEAVTLIQAYLKGADPVIGTALLAKLAYDSAMEDKKLTRRDFLKKTIAGIYFLSEAPSMITSDLLNSNKTQDEKSARRKIDRFLNDLNERAHPETNAIIVTLRNNLFAQKAETIAGKLDLENKNRKPEVAITIGARHHGIEDALSKKDEERTWLIDAISRLPGLEETRDKIATIARFDFNKEKDKWEMTDRFKDPHLTKIAK